MVGRNLKNNIHIKGVKKTYIYISIYQNKVVWYLQIVKGIVE